jgi:hypothetical protein
VYFPTGSTQYSDGTSELNSEIAGRILRALESSGSTTCPVPNPNIISGANQAMPLGWDIEYKGDATPRQVSFIEHLKHQQTLFAHAYGMSERAIFEGTSGTGTKAEAGIHQDFSKINMDIVSYYFAKQFEEQILKRYLYQVVGEEQANAIHIIPAPINPDKQLYMQSIASKVLVREDFDIDALVDGIDMPKATKTLTVSGVIDNDSSTGISEPA